MNILGFDQVDFLLKDKVKVSFYANNLYTSPVNTKVRILNNIFTPNIETIGAMKLELMLRRSNFRDYYDIYSILKTGISIKKIVSLATKYCNHRLKSKNIIAFISNGQNYKMEKEFVKLQPKYNVSEREIEEYIRKCIIKDYNKNKNKA